MVSSPRLAGGGKVGGSIAGIPVVLPSLRDLRLRLSLVIMSIQVLGQTVLGFKLSIAQILISLLTCAVLGGIVGYLVGRPGKQVHLRRKKGEGAEQGKKG